MLAVIAILATLVWPWSNQQIQQLKTQYSQRSDIDRIAPGEFQESSDGSRVFFIDKDSAQTASNVFIVTNDSRGESVTSSAQRTLGSRKRPPHGHSQRWPCMQTQTGSEGVKISEFKAPGPFTTE